MKKEIETFLNNLQKSRDLENQLKRQIIQKIIKREYKSKNSNIPSQNIIKRRILKNCDIAIYEYLYHSKLIKECQKYKFKDIHLQTDFNTFHTEMSPKNSKKIKITSLSLEKSCFSKNAYSTIKRNSLANLSNSNLSFNDDESLISATEDALDRMYSKSINLQKDLLNKPNQNITKKLKEVVKIDELNEVILKTNRKKLNL